MSQLQNSLFPKEYTCCLHFGKLLELRVALFNLKPWSPPFGVHFSGLLLAVQMMDNLEVEFVDLKPWPFWQLFLALLTSMLYFIDPIVGLHGHCLTDNTILLTRAAAHDY